MEVEELTYNMVFEWSKKTFATFNNSLKNSIKGFGALTASVAAAQSASFAFTKSIADQNDELEKLATRLNVSSQDYEKLVFGAEDFGASAEDVTSSLRSLRKAQEDVLLGKGDIQAFSELGINPSMFEDTNDIFLAISDSLSKIDSRSKKLNLLDRIGVSENLLQLMESGSDNIKKMGDELALLGGVKTNEQLAVAGEFQAVFLRTQKIVGGVSNLVGTELTKNYNKALATINKFFIKNAEAITLAFNKFFDVLNTVSKTIVFIFERVSNLVMGVTQLFGGFENTVMAVSAAFVALKFNMIASFAAPLIVGTLLFAVIEDIVGFLTGKESMIGDFFNIDGTKVLKSIQDFFSYIKEAYNAFMADVEQYGLGQAILNGLVKAGEKIMQFFDYLLEMIINLASKIKDYIIEAFADFNPLKGIQNTLNSLNPFASAPTQATQTTNNNNNNNANVTVNVSGGGGDVIDQIEEYFKSGYTSLFGTN